MEYGQSYTYACIDGSITDQELCVVCQADGSLSIPPPNCSGSKLEIIFDLFFLILPL